MGLVISELRHFAAVLRGRVYIARPLACNRCPAVARTLTQAQAQVYARYRAVSCERCPEGLLEAVPHPSDPTSLERAR